ncbi:MAG TPA: site-2 protease family protein [Chloroflexi bacterium]|nr:site-2 protease family protein [Chloroflexota bacterium]
MYQSPTSSATLEQAEDLLRDINDLYTSDSMTLDRPQTGHIRFRGQFLCDLSSCYDELRGRFERHGFTPFVREEQNGISLVAAPIVFDPPDSKWIINLVLVIATILSTLFVGTLSEFAAQGLEGIPGLDDLWLGIPYCLSLMTILGAHELGHYFAARYHKVPVTLPYFIPLPVPPIGTLGAFIRLKAPVKNKRALLDVGAAGPLAGLLFAIPILLYGLAISPVEPLPDGGYTLEGNSVLYALAKIAVKGQMLPNGTEDVFLSQVAWAGWVGLLVTGLNLIPVGQLDGGHIAYALFGKRARLFFWPVIVTMIALVVITQTFMWGFWALLLFILGRYYAEPLDDITPLDGRRRVLAITSLVLFLLVFVPIPLRIVAS